MTRSSRLFLSASLLLALSGCFGVTSEGRRLRGDVDSNIVRIEKLEQ